MSVSSCTVLLLVAYYIYLIDDSSGWDIEMNNSNIGKPNSSIISFNCTMLLDKSLNFIFIEL